MSLRGDLLEFADLFEFAGQALGPCELEQDCSWAPGMSAVLRLRDARGVNWFAKRHREHDRYEAEVTAYRPVGPGALRPWARCRRRAPTGRPVMAAVGWVLRPGGGADRVA